MPTIPVRHRFTSDTTLKFDREVKIPLYAASGISEVWIANLLDREIEVYRHPESQEYQTIQQYQQGEILSILALEGITVSVNEIFGFWFMRSETQKAACLALSAANGFDWSKQIKQ